MEKKNEIMPSVLKLMRAMRRHPMRPEHEFPPAVGRMLMTLRANDGAGPAELCELMDVRPSSMSELLGRMEKHELIRRIENENDKRATKVYLSDAGRESVQKIEAKFAADNAKLAECFTPDELAQFCALCDKLSAHVESLPEAQSPCGHRGHRGPHGPCGGHRHHRGHRPQE